MQRKAIVIPRPGRLRARRRILAAGSLIVIGILSSAMFAGRPLTHADGALVQEQRDQAGLRQVAELQATLSEFQLLVQPLTLAQPSAGSVENVGLGARLALTVDTRVDSLVALLPLAGFPGNVRELRSADVAFQKATAGLASLAAGVPVAKATASIVQERAAYKNLVSVAEKIANQLQKDSDVAVQEAKRNFIAGRVIMLIVATLATLATMLLAFIFAQRAHRRQHVERANEERQAYTASLQEALEMSSAEPDVYEAVEMALRESVPHLQVEMLVADSSRAHLRQALSVNDVDSEPRSGCGVVSPLDCPATVRGHTLVFPTSGALGACPHLRGRSSGPLSAACIPISVAGKTVGVTHATGNAGSPPAPADVAYLEITTRRASERIAMLRAFEKSETQAQSDPLTGLLNRRSLENRVRDLQREGVSYHLAYGDLDHFKTLNDTHGHEAGDQALRLFSRVLRDSIRPNDVAARYGGEEFVIVLPECDTDEATQVLERVRERLALAQASGGVAPFTVSFGLASSADADTFEEIVDRADRALLAAKAAGRNRVLVASQPGGVDAVTNPG